jgi:tetratricopeptide (TPR) repeat protein
LQIALGAVNELAPGNPHDVRTWGIWGPLAAHAEAVARHGDGAGLAGPTERLMNELGLYLKARGQFLAAERLYRRGLEISESALGPDHPDVATRLNNLAIVLRDTGRAAEAEPLFRRALEVGERVLGPDHPTVAIRLNNLAMLLQGTGRAAEAEPLSHRALEVSERALGPDHPDIALNLNNLAMVLRDTGRAAEAEPLYRRALAILGEFRRRTGHEHPNFRVASANYAGLLRALGWTLEQAAEALQEVADDDGPAREARETR